jgi:hypothetical protein
MAAALLKLNLDRFKPEHRENVQTFWCLMLQFPDDLFAEDTGRLVQYACNLGESIGWCRRDLGHFSDALLDASITGTAEGRRKHFRMLAAIVRNVCTTAQLLHDLFGAIDTDPADCELSQHELVAAGLGQEIHYVGKGPTPLTFADWVKCVGDVDPFVVDEAKRLSVIMASKRFDLGRHKARMAEYKRTLEAAAHDVSEVATGIRAEYAPESGNTEGASHQAAMRTTADLADSGADFVGMIAKRIGAEYAAGFADLC